MSGEIEHGNETTVGTVLRASRLRRDEDLRNVAQTLRVRLLYLEAIEEGRYSELPGNAYAIGFIRAYAEHLGLDSEEVVRRYKAEASDGRNSSLLVFPSPIPENSVPGGAILLIGVLVAIMAYGGWYVSSTQNGFLTNLVSPIPGRLASMVGKEGTDNAEEKEPSSAAAIVAESPPKKIEDKPEAKPEPAPTVTVTVTSSGSSATPEKNKAVDVPKLASVIKKEPVSAIKEDIVKKEVKKVVEASTSATVVVPPKAESPSVEANRSASDTSGTPTTSQTNVTPKKAVENAVAKVAASTKEPTNTESSVPPPAKPSPAKAVSKQSPSVAKPSAPAPQVATTKPTEGTVRILVRAKDDSWILIRDVTSNKLITRKLLRAGEVYRVPNRPGLTLQAGNAGALEISVDGEAVPAIGAVGAVLRSVALDATRLREGKAVAP